jgi:hypothetical protein
VTTSKSPACHCLYGLGHDFLLGSGVDLLDRADWKRMGSAFDGRRRVLSHREGCDRDRR